jgi:hypothetical protein
MLAPGNDDETVVIGLQLFRKIPAAQKRYFSGDISQKMAFLRRRYF